METVKITINGQIVETTAGNTILKAARSIGINIPTLCYHPYFENNIGACRICIVEVEGCQCLVASCVHPVMEGMKIKTHSPKVLKARKILLELLVANHNLECLVCKRNGNCQLQNLCEEYGIIEDKFKGKKRHREIDHSSEALVSDPDKCILCGKCIKACCELQDVHALKFAKRGFDMHVSCTFERKYSKSVCIDCGQCVIVCPTASLVEKDSIEDVFNALSNPDKYVIVQTAPSIRVTIGEAMGMAAGSISTGKMVSGLRKLGFQKVFDTAFGADLTVMEEASELIRRLKNNGALPMMTSCSPGWVKFVETFYPELIPNLSTCKSPHQMLGAIVKSHFASKNNINPKDIFMVSVMPCTAKKFEIDREANKVNGISDVDSVITTRELAKIFQTGGVNFSKLEDSEFDNPLGFASSAGEIFGSSGGVMEAALRTAYYLITGKELEEINFNAVRGLNRLKEASININGTKLNVAAVSTLGETRKLIKKIKKGEIDYSFIEVMTCPGGCIAGGGQPYAPSPEILKARMESLYKIDLGKEIRKAHNNPFIKQLYDDFLGEPLSETSHKYLHTSYTARSDAL